LTELESPLELVMVVLITEPLLLPPAIVTESAFGVAVIQGDPIQSSSTLTV